MRKRLKPGPYTHKLNLLVPGCAVCKGIALLALAAAGCAALGWDRLAAILGYLLAAVLVLFFILLCVEQHQDRVHCERALAEDAARERQKKKY